MRAVVGVKRCLDYAIKVRVNKGMTGVELKGLKQSMNPFDEIAVEEALRMKEAGHLKEVVAMSIGPKQSVDTIRTALAMGADWGIHIKTDMSTDQELQPLAVAKVFQAMIEKHEFDMCILGKQSIDDDYVQTGQILGALATIPCATFSSEIQFSEDQQSAIVTREVDQGLQKVQVQLPAVFTCDLRLNTPRFANVKSILKAKKKKVEAIALEELGLDVAPRIKIEEVRAPEERQGGVLVADVDELIAKLKDEAKVL